MAKKILIIEDEENVAELLRINMCKRGYAVDVASDGAEGCRKVQADPPDVLFLNVRLPEMDGWEVCRRVKADPVLRRILVIFVTAAAQQGDRQKARESGGDYFVTKPFDMAELVRMITLPVKERETV
jgi:DNA-binding response OmpR family regulator